MLIALIRIGRQLSQGRSDSQRSGQDLVRLDGLVEKSDVARRIRVVDSSLNRGRLKVPHRQTSLGEHEAEPRQHHADRGFVEADLEVATRANPRIHRQQQQCAPRDRMAGASGHDRLRMPKQALHQGCAVVQQGRHRARTLLEHVEIKAGRKTTRAPQQDDSLRFPFGAVEAAVNGLAVRGADRVGLFVIDRENGHLVVQRKIEHRSRPYQGPTPSGRLPHPVGAASLAAMDVVEALKTRVSIRSFLDTPVGEQQVREILDAARWSPSGGNLQPWKVRVVTGDAKAAVSNLAVSTMAENPAGEADEFPIYPPSLWEPYRTRRYKIGEDMYARLGIPRSDKPARLQWVARNFMFFGAPVGLFFVIERKMGRGQWAHLGMFMQSIALTATARGLGTCMQESWATVRKSLHQHFALPDEEVVYCGMALGHPDPSAAVNQLRSDREDVDGFATFEGF